MHALTRYIWWNYFVTSGSFTYLVVDNGVYTQHMLPKNSDVSVCGAKQYAYVIVAFYVLVRYSLPLFLYTHMIVLNTR